MTMDGTFGIGEALILTGGLALCIGGAEALVRGASRIASWLRISPLIVGFTIVAFGTSAPELAVSLRAAAAGETGIAIANLVGSNIANVWLILGVVALVVPLAVEQAIVRVHIPILLAVSAGSLVLLLDGALDLLDAALLLLAFIAYLAYLRWEAVRYRMRLQVKQNGNGKSQTSSAGTRWVAVLLATSGLAGLLIGAQWTLRASIHLATALHVSNALIGLTIVAVGTSLPEMTTSVVAAIRGQREIAVGNIVGSCVFNTTCILGLSGLFPAARGPVDPSITHFALPLMLGSAATCLPVFFTGRRIARWEGAVFLAAYGAFLAYEVLSSLHAYESLHLLQASVRVGVSVACLVFALSVAREFLGRARQPRKR